MFLHTLLLNTLFLITTARPNAIQPLDEFLCGISSCWDWHILYHRVYFRRDADDARADSFVKCVNSFEGHQVAVRTLDEEESLLANEEGSMHVVFNGGSSVLELLMREKQSSLFVFVFEEKPRLEEFFRSVWAKEFLNVVAVVGGKQPEVFTFEPFSPEGFRVVNLTGTSCLGFFYDKAKNLYGHNVTISMFPDRVRAIPYADGTKGYRGVDGRFAENVEKALNANFVYQMPPDGVRYGSFVNNTLTGALAEIANRRADIALNIRYTLYADGVEMTFFLERRNIAFLVPKGAAVSQFLNIVRPYRGWTWLSVIGCYLLVVCVYICVQRIALATHPFKATAKKDLVFTFFKTLIGEPVSAMPKPISLRQLIMVWMIFCFVTSTMYCAKLESIFVQPEYEPDPRSLKDLHRIPTPYYSEYTHYEPIINHTYPGLFEKLQKHIILVPTIDDLVNLPNNATLIIRRELARYLIYRTFNSEIKRPSYHMVPDFLSSLPKAYILPRGSYLVNRMNQMVRVFTENGLLAYWQTRTIFLDRIRGKASTDIENPDEFEEAEHGKVVLTMVILQSAFYFWIIGISTAAGVFLFEVFRKPRSQIEPEERFDSI